MPPSAAPAARRSSRHPSRLGCALSARCACRLGPRPTPAARARSPASPSIAGAATSRPPAQADALARGAQAHRSAHAHRADARAHGAGRPRHGRRRASASAINLSGGTVTRDHAGTSAFEETKKFADERFPGRFLEYMNLDYADWDTPDFAPQAVAQVEEGARLGAAGFKEFKRLGLFLRDKNGQLLEIDDPKLDPMWQALGRARDARLDPRRRPEGVLGARTTRATSAGRSSRTTRAGGSATRRCSRRAKSSSPRSSASSRGTPRRRSSACTSATTPRTSTGSTRSSTPTPT